MPMPHPILSSRWACRYADMVQLRLVEGLAQLTIMEITIRLASGLTRMGELTPGGFSDSALLPFVDLLLRWFVAAGVAQTR